MSVEFVCVLIVCGTLIASSLIDLQMIKTMERVNAEWMRELHRLYREGESYDERMKRCRDAGENGWNSVLDVDGELKKIRGEDGDE